MNYHTPKIDTLPNREEASRALDLLRQWAAGASQSEIDTLDPALRRLIPGQSVNYPPLSRRYPEAFVADDAYKKGLPDLQNGPSSLIRGKNSISNTWASRISAFRSDFTRATMAI